MAIDFQPLRDRIAEKKASWYQLEQGGIDNSTVDRLRHDRNITTNTIAKICELLDCDPEEILRRTPK